MNKALFSVALAATPFLTQAVNLINQGEQIAAAQVELTSNVAAITGPGMPTGMELAQQSAASMQNFVEMAAATELFLSEYKFCDIW